MTDKIPDPLRYYDSINQRDIAVQKTMASTQAILIAACATFQGYYLAAGGLFMDMASQPRSALEKTQKALDAITHFMGVDFKNVTPHEYVNIITNMTHAMSDFAAIKGGNVVLFQVYIVAGSCLGLMIAEMMSLVNGFDPKGV